MRRSDTGSDATPVRASALQGVPDTLFIPLAARIYVSRRFPELFHDQAALSLAALIPDQELLRASAEYMHLASVGRYYSLDQIARTFAAGHGRCNLVNLGAGLETMAFRLADLDAVFHSVDLPEVIQTRRAALPPAPHETLIGGDIFDFGWAARVDASLPTLFISSGVFQYFHEPTVVEFISGLQARFPGSELVFDAASPAGLRYANRFVARTGNTAAGMHFSIDDAEAFARRCRAELLDTRQFFAAFRQALARRVSLSSRIAMAVVDRTKRLQILWLRLSAS